jgi:hypothetical protein
MRKFLGVIALLMGAGLAAWIGYNYLVEMQPEAKGRNPLLPIVVTVGLLYQGQKWLRQKDE